MFKFLASTAIVIACAVGLVVLGVTYFLLSTPRPTDLKGCLTTKLYQVRLCPAEPSYVRLKDIAPVLRNAIIVSEDGSFYSHKGFDWFELKESMEKNLEAGGWARGGSTITQQLAKNVYLSSEKSLLRKAREALIVVQIEERLSKDEILEKYLNVVQFGPKLFGIKAASLKYFGKSPAELNAAEAAFLAFLLPSPERYSVSFDKKQLTKFARSQMRVIVGRLQKYKKISDGEHDVALAQIDSFFGSPAALPAAGESDEMIEPSAEETEPKTESETESGPNPTIMEEIENLESEPSESSI